MAVLVDGVLGRFAGLPEEQIPPPPEWLALYLYGLFRVYLHGFMTRHGVTEYRVTSGYRKPAHNEAVGGAKNSAHVHGLGEDVQITAPFMTREFQQDLVNDWKQETGGFALVESDHEPGEYEVAVALGLYRTDGDWIEIHLVDKIEIQRLKVTA